MAQSDNDKWILLIGLGAAVWFFIEQQKKSDDIKDIGSEIKNGNSSVSLTNNNDATNYSRPSMDNSRNADVNLDRIMEDMKNWLTFKSNIDFNNFITAEGKRWANKHTYWYYVKLKYLGINDVQEPVSISPKLNAYGDDELLTVDMVIDALKEDRVTPEKIKAQAKNSGIYSK